MIDKENEVITRVAEALGDGVDIDSVYINLPNTFPHVNIYQADSYPVYDDGSLKEKYVHMMFEVNIFSNDQHGRKSECKRLAAIVSDTMRRMNFRRTAMTPVRNSTQTTVYGTDVHDETVYKLTLRFEGVASETHFYRR